MRTTCVKVSLFCLAILFSLFSCKPPVQEMSEKESADQVEQQFLKVNTYLRDRHQDHIDAFVGRVGWDMQVSSTGLWYWVDGIGDGRRVEHGNRVSYSYASLLLDGKPCYFTSTEEPKIITVGKGGVEAGVEEGLLLMREGDSATFIIPPHLAHGNFGDRNKIPGNTVIIYKVKLLDVN